MLRSLLKGSKHFFTIVKGLYIFINILISSLFNTSKIFIFKMNLNSVKLHGWPCTSIMFVHKVSAGTGGSHVTQPMEQRGNNSEILKGSQTRKAKVKVEVTYKPWA